MVMRRKRRRKVSKNFELQLTSLLDVLIIILVFLLKSSASSVTSFSTAPGLEMPISYSPDTPPDSLSVIVTPEAITFENNRILEFTQTATDVGSAATTYRFDKKDLDEGGRRIRPLYDALIGARDKSELLRAKSQARDATGKPLPFEGILAIQADKRVNYDTVRKIMYTAASAGFKVFRFLAVRKEEM